MAPSAAMAQTNRVPDPNAARVLVAVFKSADKELAVDASDALRNRVDGDFPAKQIYVLPKSVLVANLEASGFPVAEALEPHDQKALAVHLRADEYLTGSVTKKGDSVTVAADMVLSRDNTLVQPLGTYTAKNVKDAAKLISHELKEARKQLDFEKKCTSLGRQGQYDQAIAAAKQGIEAYPKATLVRTCMAQVMISQKAAPAQLAEIAHQIINLDPDNKQGLSILAQAYKDMDKPDSAVTVLTKLLATDPRNPRLQKDVVDALLSMADPAAARPVIDQALANNPGDPELMRTRWLILLSQKDFKAAFAQGDELVMIDTSFADTTYFIRTARAYAADSQPQKAAETAAKGLTKFANQPSLMYEQVFALRAAGQLQPALDALDRAEAAKVPIENSNIFRIQILQDLGREDEVLPVIKNAIAAGDTSTNIRALLLAAGNSARVKASTSKSLDDYAAAVDLLKYTEANVTGQSKQQAAFLLGATYVPYGQAMLTKAAEDKSCQLAKDGKDLFVEAQILLPKGGAFAPEPTAQLLGALRQLDPWADQTIKALCK